MIELTPLPPKDAIAYFRSKGLAPPDRRFDYRDIWRSEHARNFVVAKAMRTEVLELIRGQLDRTLSEGGTLAGFTEALQPELKRLGWWGRATERDPLTGEMKTVQLGSPRRLRIIFDANLRAAHAAGKWARIERVKDAFPFLRYVQVQRDSKREDHVRYHDLIRPVDDPVWDRIYPPNGWRCGCTIQQLSQAMMDRRGLSVTEEFTLEERGVLNKRTGEIEPTALGVDPAWDGNPGKAWAGMERRKATGPLGRHSGYGRISDPDAFVQSEAPPGFAMADATVSADPAVQNAAVTYQGTAYTEINQSLRGLGAMSTRLEKATKQLDRAISKTTVPSGTMLYRGQMRVPRLAIGDELTDRAFQSFSRSPAISVRFANFGDPFPPDQPNLPGLGLVNVLLRYLTPDRQRGLSLGDEEFEVVLPRGQSLRVLAEQEIKFTHPYTGEVRSIIIYDIGPADET